MNYKNSKETKPGNKKRTIRNVFRSQNGNENIIISMGRIKT